MKSILKSQDKIVIILPCKTVDTGSQVCTAFQQSETHSKLDYLDLGNCSYACILSDFLGRDGVVCVVELVCVEEFDFRRK